MIPLPSPLDEQLRRDPIRLVDVGARGSWPRGWGEDRAYVSLVGFEPDSAECERLRRSAAANETYLPQALYKCASQVPLYHYAQPSWTSLFPPNEPLLRRLWPEADDLRVTRTEQVDAVPLDQALAGAGVGWVDFIKLDTQGSELDILRGAERTLAGPLLGLELEVEFVPIYDRQPLFSDIDAHLRERGFEFVDFSTIYNHGDVTFSLRGTRGYPNLREFFRAWGGRLRAPDGALRGGKQLIYGDAIYLRNIDQYVAAVHEQDLDAGTQLVKSAVACAVIAYFDHARALVDRAHHEGWLHDGEADALRHWLTRRSRTLGRAASDLRRFAQRLKHRLSHLRW